MDNTNSVFTSAIGPYHHNCSYKGEESHMSIEVMAQENLEGLLHDTRHAEFVGMNSEFL